jgi:hypothetical protein
MTPWRCNLNAARRSGGLLRKKTVESMPRKTLRVLGTSRGTVDFKSNASWIE